MEEASLFSKIASMFGKKEAKPSSQPTSFLARIKAIEVELKSKLGRFTRLGYEPVALSKLGNGISISYIFNNPYDKVFRIIYAANPNFKGRPTIVAINVWDHFRYNSEGFPIEPTVTIELGKYDIFNPVDFDLIKNLLVSVISKPIAGEYDVSRYMQESFLVETKHVSVHEFISYVKRELNDPDPDVVDMVKLIAIANKYGVGIPTAVRISTRGTNARSLKDALDKVKVLVKKGPSRTTGDVKELGYISVAKKLRDMGISSVDIVRHTENAVVELTDALQKGAGTSVIIAGVTGVR